MPVYQAKTHSMAPFFRASQGRWRLYYSNWLQRAKPPIQNEISAVGLPAPQHAFKIRKAVKGSAVPCMQTSMRLAASADLG
jgi:hypothetical protein